MGWFAELPGSQVSHRNYSSNIINMCAVLRKPSKYDPATRLQQQTQTVPKRGMRRISLPLPRHLTPPSQARLCCGTVTAQGWQESHTPGSYLSRPQPQPHGPVVSSKPSKARRFWWESWCNPASLLFLHHLPCASSSSTKGLTWREKTGTSIPEEGKCCQSNHIPQHAAPESLGQDKRPQQAWEHGHSLPKGRRGKASEGICDSLLAANPLFTFCIPRDLPSMMI